MKTKYGYICIILIMLTLCSCLQSQNSTKIGGPCDGCEAVYEYGNRTLSSQDTLPGYMASNSKIKISGVVYNINGKTPTENVILYIYHTNEKGIYPSTDASKGWESRHGVLRGWVKTDDTGAYTFYTTRPASYPNSTVPQHIHITVKEPDKNEYYVEDIYFADDPNLTPNIRHRKNPRGGSGVITLHQKGSIKEGRRNIILGLNIPNY